MSRSIRRSSPLIEVYRWADGSAVFLVELGRGEGSALEHGLQICLKDREPITIRIQESLYSQVELVCVGEVLPISRYSPPDTDHRKKLLGFIFDLMGKEYLLRREIIWKEGEEGIDLGPRGPVVVPDEVWAQRYREGARSLLSDYRIRLHKGWRGGWEAKVNPDPNSPMAFVQDLPRRVWYTEFEREFSSPERDSEEEAIDDALRAYPIVPESRLEEWFQDNLERGTWVKPTPEEVELYTILDEKLPFFWPTEDLEAWLKE